jgi:hypothetical protein
MGGLAAGAVPVAAAWALFAIICAANLWLLFSLIG